VAPEHGFEKKIKNLTAVIPYNDAVALQFGSQTINLMMPKPQLMAMVGEKTGRWWSMRMKQISSVLFSDHVSRAILTQRQQIG
jgi:hypothetical protein